MRRCEFTDPAEADLEEISLFIASDSPRRALSFVAELRAKCLRIADHPEASQLREEYGPGIRVAVHGSYLILYSIRADAIVIEHVRHGRRDPKLV